MENAPAETPAARAESFEAPAPPPAAVETAPAQANAEPQVPAAAPAQAEAPVVIRGTERDDLLVGTARAERIEGGDGNDTIKGGGGHDILLGGAGDDRIEFTDGAQVEGGSGAATSVVMAPTRGGGPNVLLGYIRDFSQDEGDRIFTAAGRAVHVNWGPGTAPGDRTSPPATGGGDRDGGGLPTPAPTDGDSFDFGTTTLPVGPTLIGPNPPVRVEIDVDGDGVADGYILVGHRGGSMPPQPAGDMDWDPPINTGVGHALLPPDPVG
ncbi:MAG: hypothetical protein KIS90_03595 [Phenylobacterium sp.]|nr:hypothetical protein [Phenylobacterium sp.]